MSAFGFPLGVLIQSVEQEIAALGDVPQTDGRWSELTAITERLSQATVAIRKKTGRYRPSRTEGTSETLIGQARSAIDTLKREKRLTGATFRRNIVMLYGDGLKASSFDSTEVKSRKKTTNERCALIRGLGPGGVVAWAVGFAPTVWSAGTMGKDVFEYLLGKIEQLSVPGWPAVIGDTLRVLGEEQASLRDSAEFLEFTTSKAPTVSLGLIKY